MSHPTEVELQERFRQVKHKIFEARTALEETMFVRVGVPGTGGTPHYADRFFAVAEQHLNLASLALAEGRQQMRDIG